MWKAEQLLYFGDGGAGGPKKNIYLCCAITENVIKKMEEMLKAHKNITFWINVNDANISKKDKEIANNFNGFVEKNKENLVLLNPSTLPGRDIEFLSKRYDKFSAELPLVNHGLRKGSLKMVKIVEWFIESWNMLSNLDQQALGEESEIMQQKVKAAKEKVTEKYKKVSNELSNLTKEEKKKNTVEEFVNLIKNEEIKNELLEFFKPFEESTYETQLKFFNDIYQKSSYVYKDLLGLFVFFDDSGNILDIPLEANNENVSKWLRNAQKIFSFNVSGLFGLKNDALGADYVLYCERPTDRFYWRRSYEKDESNEIKIKTETNAIKPSTILSFLKDEEDEENTQREIRKFSEMWMDGEQDDILSTLLMKFYFPDIKIFFQGTHEYKTKVLSLLKKLNYTSGDFEGFIQENKQWNHDKIDDFLKIAEQFETHK